MADYSEFPTTPTAWQEIHQLETEDPPPPQPRQRRPDLTALVPGVVFTILATVLLAGADIRLDLFGNGALFWVALIVVGGALLVAELRKVRRRR